MLNHQYNDDSGDDDSRIWPVLVLVVIVAIVLVGLLRILI